MNGVKRTKKRKKKEPQKNERREKAQSRERGLHSLSEKERRYYYHVEQRR